MKKIFVLAVGLLVVPQMVSAQLEIGLDAGFGIGMPDADGADNITRFGVPSGGYVPFLSQARVGFAAGETLIVESILGFNYVSFGEDDSLNTLVLLPGVNFLVGPQFYVRGEAGLIRVGSSGADAETQYGFGAGAGLRRSLGSGALLRAEVGADKWLETEEGADDGLLDIHAVVGVSVVIGG
jgi:hypothetical protein